MEGLHFDKISVEDNAFLVAKFDELEVQEAIWECRGSKSTSLDDLNFNFIKPFFSTMKNDFMKVL